VSAPRAAVQISDVQPGDRAGWEPLARGYREFYKTPTTDAEFDAAWARVLARKPVHGLVARVDGRIVGIAHYLMHGSTWADSVCYLQDLFTSSEARGAGVARALIDAVAARARAAKCARYYWLTQENNNVARILYEKVARYHGFIRYDFPLDPPA
jgi:GNAT superfamily N-acetyltransferase